MKKFFIDQCKISQKFFNDIFHSNTCVTGGYYFSSDDDARFPSELVVVFDEARFLLGRDSSTSLFRTLRAAHRSMEFRNMILVFVDTISTISNFAPPYIYDTSYRPHRQFELLPVYYEIISYNSCQNQVNYENQRPGDLARLFSLGRPMWNACFFYNTVVTLPDIDNAIRFAMMKLANSPSPNMQQNHFACLAAAAIMFGVWGIMDHSVATALVSSYMGTALFLGDDRLRMFVHYVPEPILAEAAAQLVYNYSIGKDMKVSGSLVFPGKTLLMVLDKFDATVISGLIDAGNIGELVARMIVSFASAKIHIDMAKKAMKAKKDKLVLFSDPIKVSAFLDLLVPTEYQKYYELRYEVPCFDAKHKSVKELREYGEIAFTTFELLYSVSEMNLSQFYLERAFEHRYAFVGRTNQPGCDLVIPVRINKEGSISYSAIIIQVKNYEEALSPSLRFLAAGGKLKPSYCSPYQKVPNDYISIFLELNFKRVNDKVRKPTKRAAAAHLRYFGNHMVVIDQTSLDFLGKHLKKMLEELSNKKMDYVQQGGKVNVLYAMDPHRFTIPPISLPNGVGGDSEED